jgi:hypothetical protein
MKSLAVLLILLALPSLLPAQTAAVMDELLETQAVSYAQAAYVILRAGAGQDFAVPATAFAAAREKGWVPKNAASHDPASLGAVSLLIMRAFELKGGFMYSFFHSPRHAVRELSSLRLIRGQTDPDQWVSGDNLLFMVGGVLSRQENEGKL